MLRPTLRRALHAQGVVPVIPQGRVAYSGSKKISVGYLMCRHAVVKPELHPLEVEMGFTLEKEHARYGRNDTESLSHFLAQKGFTLDNFNRQDPKQVTSNFFNLEEYQDVLTMFANRWAPRPRVTPNDFVDLFAEGTPARHTIFRALHEYLYLIVKFEASGAWGLPYVPRADDESLRMTADRAVYTHHETGLDAFIWSNAPQAVVKRGEDDHTYFYHATYLAGKPNFDRMLPKVVDHAWVTRQELREYDFADAGMRAVLRDVCIDGSGDVLWQAGDTMDPAATGPSSAPLAASAASTESTEADEESEEEETEEGEEGEESESEEGEEGEEGEEAEEKEEDAANETKPKA